MTHHVECIALFTRSSRVTERGGHRLEGLPPLSLRAAVGAGSVHKA